MRVLLLIVCFALPVFAQEGAIPPEEIPGEAELAARRLEGFGALPDLKTAQGLEEAVERLEKLSREPFANLGRTVSLAELEGLEAEWKRTREKLLAWDRELKKYATDLRNALAELDAMGKRWQLSDSPQLPREVATRVRSTMDAIAALKPRLAEAQRRLVARREAFVRAEKTVVAVLAKVAETRAEIQARLFTLDAPAIWRVRGAPLSEQVRGTSEVVQAELEEWAAESRVQGIVHALVALLAFFLILRLRKFTGEWTEQDESLGPTLRVLSHPIAATLLVALAVVPWAYPGAPMIVYDLASLLVLAPLLVLLHSLQWNRAALLLFALLFLVDRLRFLSSEGAPLHRGLLLLECLLGLWAGLQVGRLTRKRADAWGRWAARGMRLSVVLFLAAAVANVAGALQLAVLVAGATTQVIYLAVVFAAGGMILRGVTAALLRTRTARRVRMVDRHRALLERRIGRWIPLVLFGIWAWIALDAFAVRRHAVDAARSVFLATLELGKLSISLWDVVGFLLVIYASVLVSRLVRFVLDEDILPRLPLPRGVPTAISTVTHYIIVTLGFFFAMAASGIELSKLAFLIGAFGIGIGFGLQNIVGNFVSGLILLFERPIKVGDWLQVEDLHGEVTRIGIRSSTLRTLDAAEVIIPNGSLLESKVINWTHSDRRRRIEVSVGVSYGSDVEKVIETLLETALQLPVALDYPKPDVLFVGFGESSLDFRIRFWISSFSEMSPALSAMHVAIRKALQKAGIEIPFPQRDVHLRNSDTVPE